MLLAFSKEKVENEQTYRFRAKALSASIIYGVVSVIIHPIISFALDGNFVLDSDASTILIQMFIFYFIMKYIFYQNVQKQVP